MSSYSLESILSIFNFGNPFMLNKEIIDKIRQIDGKVVPIIIEKNHDDKRKHEYRSKRQSTPKQPTAAEWDEIRTPFKSTVIEKEEEGLEKYNQSIRMCLNKISNKNYDGQKQEIINNLENCQALPDVPKEQLDDNIKLIAISIFNIASTNKYHAQIYAQLYKELTAIYPVFEDILVNFLTSFSNSVKDINYVEPETNYEQYCLYNKSNDIRKATAIFIIHLMKIGSISILRVLNIIVAFQDLTNKYIGEESRTNEVEEMTEVLYLLLKEGKDAFEECKGEWIWKFVILKNIQTMSKYKKQDKPSLSTRAIFKYMDMLEEVKSIDGGT